MQVYLEMLQEYSNTSGIYIPNPNVEPSIAESLYIGTGEPAYCDPNVFQSINNNGTYIAVPTSYELYINHNHTRKRAYTPYKRINHLREHINRITYCQYVSISNACLAHIEQLFTQEPGLSTDHDVYRKVHASLYKHGFRKYIEHIHYLIMHVTKKPLKIGYTTYSSIRLLFVQMENQFKIDTFLSSTRKNFVSYQIILQFILFIFHIHPNYYLPTIKDANKREHYYNLCFLYFSGTPSYDKHMANFIEKTKTCKHCLAQQYMFDTELTSLLLPPPHHQHQQPLHTVTPPPPSLTNQCHPL